MFHGVDVPPSVGAAMRLRHMLYLAAMAGATDQPELPACPHCGESHGEGVLVCPASQQPLPLAGRLLDGKFRFIRLLGEGGMGAVWQAENVFVHRFVAIKLMHSQYASNENTLTRFRNEATAAGRIGSRHICDILDFGQSELGPYIVMEMLSGPKPGGSARGGRENRSRTRNPGRPDKHWRASRRPTARASIHRDLKPENIFLSEPTAGHLLVKLMDFGISKFTATSTLQAHRGWGVVGDTRIHVARAGGGGGGCGRSIRHLGHGGDFVSGDHGARTIHRPNVGGSVGGRGHQRPT